MLTKLSDKLMHFSRRGFIKSAAALGASAAIYGCGSSGDGDIIYGGGDAYPPLPDLETTSYYYGTGGHNCGAKCISKAWVKNGKIIRITSVGEEALYGVNYDPDSYGNPQQRACTRCRSYKFRLYHPGRLKYPLKQTKARGDLTGFVRMSWDDALNEVCRKHKATFTKYGPESVHSLYACGSYTAMQGGGYTGIWTARSGSCLPLNYTGGATGYTNDYSYHQSESYNNQWTGFSYGSLSTTNLAGGTAKNIVSFGSNAMTTRNNVVHPMVIAYKEARKRGTNVIYIAPELVDEGVNAATEFIPTKPYTTNALLAGMLYEMLVNTFNKDGSIMATPWLDVDFIDAAIYGFFDSPQYWIKKTTGTPAQGTISVIDPGDTTYTKVNAIPPGMSFSAWIMGDDDRLMRAQYNAVNNYVANKFADAQTHRNMALCSQSVKAGAGTQYIRKQEYQKKKDAAWASKITGIPEQRIKDLAKMFADPDQHPIFCNYGAGIEKQLDGMFTRFALQAFMIITKTYGRTADGMGDTGAASGGSNGFAGTTSTNSRVVALPNYTLNRATTPVGSVNRAGTTPNLSVTQWHNAIRVGFMDVMLDPNKGSKVYTGKYIPDYKPTNDFPTTDKDLANWKNYIGRVYHDDGGAKALVKMKRTAIDPTTNAGGALSTDADGYYEYETDANGKPIYAGYRWIMNSGGNILMNQHMNPNDTAEMLESIPSCGQTNNPDNPDDLCIISLDNFLSPSPRWSDYVFPMSTQWEHDNQQSAGGQNIIMPMVSPLPGESRSTWNMTIAFLEAYEKIDPAKQGMSLQFTGSDNTGGADPIPGDQYIDKFKRAYMRSAYPTTTTSRYYGKSFEEALKVQYELPNPGAFNPTKATITTSAPRTNIDAYLANLKSNVADKNTVFYANVTTASSAPTSFGGQYANGTTATFPSGTPGRFQVYTEVMEWVYAHRYEKWHKYLKDMGLPTGQRIGDIEGDTIIPFIPLYLNYEDSFMEAYGGLSALPADNRFLVTTSHSRYRAHSSVAESPLVREMTHRVRGGKPYSCNDWGTYSLSEIRADGSIPRLNSAVGTFGQTTDFRRASWHEVLMNEKDAARMGIVDGDLIEMSNPVGAVRVIARLTKRAAKGFIALHQGAWYDPDPADGIDDGSCANTIMCTKPSRLDHGNGQQSAMVSIKKVTV